MSENIITKYLKCNECKDKCCRKIGGKYFISDEEDVPRDDFDKKFYKIIERTCAKFENELCKIYEKRPFMCKAYPFIVANGKIFISDGCPRYKDFVAKMANKEVGVKLELRLIRIWVEKNAPKDILKFWESELNRGVNLGIEIKM